MAPPCVRPLTRAIDLPSKVGVASRAAPDCETLLLEFVVNLPEAQGALGGFHRQLAVILEGDLQR